MGPIIPAFLENSPSLKPLVPHVVHIHTYIHVYICICIYEVESKRPCRIIYEDGPPA